MSPPALLTVNERVSEVALVYVDATCVVRALETRSAESVVAVQPS
jgi:hypothetical protein